MKQTTDVTTVVTVTAISHPINLKIWITFGISSLKHRRERDDVIDAFSMMSFYHSLNWLTVVTFETLLFGKPLQLFHTQQIDWKTICIA